MATDTLAILEQHTGVTWREHELGEDTADSRAVLGKTALDLLAMADFDPTTPPEPLRRQFGRVGMRVHTWDHLAAHPHAEESMGLKPQQIAPFTKAIKFSEALSPEAQLLESPSLDDLLTRKGYLELPTGYGKTVMMVYLAKRLGIGTTIEATGRRSRLLVVVPSHNILDQTIGDSDKRGFNTFAPELTLAELSGRTRDKAPDTDVVVITYDSFISRYREDPDYFEQFDTMFFDEAHELMGSGARHTLEQVGKGRLCIGFTATAEYDETRQLSDILPEEIESIDLRETIESGFLRKARLQVYGSGVTVDLAVGSQDYTVESLRQLRLNQERNELITRLAATQVEEGRRGVISCIPGADENGNSCAHAYQLADQLSQMMIVDATGTERYIIAKAISGEDADSAEHRKAFERGEIDILLYVDMIGQGWDSDQVGFLLAARPTASKLKAIQRFGRGTRPSDHYDDTLYIEIIDMITSLRPYTIFDVMGEESFTQDLVVGPPAPTPRAPSHQPGGTRHKTGVRKPITPSIPAKRSQQPWTPNEDMRFTSLNGVLIDEVFVGEVPLPVADALPDGWVPLAPFAGQLNMRTNELIATINRGIKRYNYRTKLTTPERPVYHATGPDTLALFISPVTAAYLSRVETIVDATSKDVPRSMAAILTGRSISDLEQALRSIHALPYERRSPSTGKIGSYISVNTLKLLTRYSPRTPLPTVKDMALKYNRSGPQVSNALNRLAAPTIVYGTGVVRTNGIRGSQQLIPAETQQILHELYTSPVPEDAIDLKELSRHIERAPDSIETELRAIGLGHLVRTSRAARYSVYAHAEDWPLITYALQRIYPSVHRRVHSFEQLRSEQQLPLPQQLITSQEFQAAVAASAQTPEVPEAEPKPLTVPPKVLAFEGRALRVITSSPRLKRLPYHDNTYLTMLDILRIIDGNPKARLPNEQILMEYINDAMSQGTLLRSATIDPRENPVKTVYYTTQFATTLLNKCRIQRA